MPLKCTRKRPAAAKKTAMKINTTENACDSSGNSDAQNAVKTVLGLMRTNKLDLEKQIKAGPPDATRTMRSALKLNARNLNRVTCEW